jgi:hypothetical protein
MTKYSYVVAYSGIVEADTPEEAEKDALDAHLLLSDVTIDVTETRDDAHDAT